MNTRPASPLFVLSLCLLSCALSACGNKGPLVLADKPAAAEPGAQNEDAPVAPESKPAPDSGQDAGDAGADTDGDG